MAVTKITYGTSTQITPFTLNSLANGSARECTAVVNTSDLFDDAMVSVTTKVSTGTPAEPKCAFVYVYGSEDGTNYEDTVTGSDAGITLTDPPQLRLLGTISMPTQSLTYKKIFGSVALAFGGTMPRKWGLVVKNSCGIAFDSTGNSAYYTGITYTTT